MRGFVGYERQVGSDRTLGLQAYLERRQDHDAFVAGLAEGADVPDENRTLVTMRLEQLWAYQTWRLSLFVRNFNTNVLCKGFNGFDKLHVIIIH